MGVNANISNQSTEKAMRVLEYLSAKANTVRLSEIAAALKINESTVSRFVTALHSCGYITQDSETSRYRLSYKICRVANRFLANSEYRGIIHPYLIQIMEKFSESCCFSKESGFKTVYIDVVAGFDRALMSLQHIGNSAPMHCTGNGKIILSSYSDEKLNAYIEEEGLKKYTENTIVTKERLREELDMIRISGHAYDNEECEVGVRCIACPIRDYTGNIIAGVCVTGPTSRFTKERIAENLPYLKTMSKEISYQLGYAENK